jgi:hypothetical protein
MSIHHSTLDEKESFNFCGIKYAGKGIHALMEEVEAERYRYDSKEAHTFLASRIPMFLGIPDPHPVSASRIRIRIR